ncbi:MAG: ABC transporter permease [Sporichthyaceae bacterium]
MNWAWENREMLAREFGEHAYLALIPLFVGLLIALPLGVFLSRSDWSRTTTLTLCAGLQAIPALSWFVVLPGLLSTRLDAGGNVIVGLTLLSAAMLTRSVCAAVGEVPADLSQTAEAVGFGPVSRATRIELPLAGPAIIAGIRDAAVACIGLVTLAALVGIGGLGRVLTQGFANSSEAEVLVGVALVVAMAVGLESLLSRAQQKLLPWSKLAPIR